MKTLKTMLLTLLVLAVSVPAYAQTDVDKTFLSATIAAGDSTLVVGSATGITANTTLLYIDREAMDVTGVSGTTITVRRGTRGTRAAPHLANSPIYAGGFNEFVAQDPTGRCTRANEQFLPRINLATGNIWDCILSGTNTTSMWVAVNVGTPIGYSVPYKKIPAADSTYQALVSDYIIGGGSSVTISLTLPAVTGMIGKIYIVQVERTGATTIRIGGLSGQLINNAATIDLDGSARLCVTCNIVNFPRLMIYYDGLGWWAGKAAF